MKKQVLAVVGAALLLGGTATAQTMPQSGSPAMPMSMPMPMASDAAMMMPASDAQFVAMMSRLNEEQIGLSRAVLGQTKSEAVRTFAQRLIDDSSSAEVALRSAARPGSFVVPTSGGRVMSRMARMLQGDREPQLDADYMTLEIGAQKRSLSLLQWEAASGTDAGVKAFATAQVPLASTHVNMALAYVATNGMSTRVSVGGQILGGGASGNGGAAGGNGGGGPFRPDGKTSGNGSPATAPNGTAGNNPSSATGGSTTGTNNGSGGTQNTPGSKATTPPTSAVTPQPNMAITPSPKPS